MNTKNKILGFTFSILFALTMPAHANSVTLSGPANVLPGSTFQLEVYADFSSAGLIGGGFLLGLDPALVSLDGITIPPTLDAEPDFTCPGNAFCTDTPTSKTISLSSFSLLLAPGHAAPALIATLTLTALGSGVASFTMADDPAVAGNSGPSWFDISFAVAPATYNPTSVTISAVPVPPAAWLFTSGLIALGGWARRTRIATR